MPRAVWIWDLGRVCLSALLLHRSAVKSLAWGPCTAPSTLASRLAISTSDASLFMWSPVGTSNGNCPLAMTRLRWRSDGLHLLMQDKDCICVCAPGPPDGVEADTPAVVKALSELRDGAGEVDNAEPAKSCAPPITAQPWHDCCCCCCYCC
mmetsp:Transcript_89212/g.286000  ORF Transcript_89212/g.286000 Transcript_89212/m.286000 type:complete len:151 (-) Transcript_89212:23-475(-)